MRASRATPHPGLRRLRYVAIAVGGPGAVFWMWIIALLGSASAFVESTLAQLFKKREKESFIGGPAYYIFRGLKTPWLAALFAILISVTFGLSYNSIQRKLLTRGSDLLTRLLDMRIVWGVMAGTVVLGVIICILSTLAVVSRVAYISKDDLYY